MTETTYRPGDWLAACSMCGRQMYASELVKNWMGQYRCPKHNEIRHPQDFVRGRKDDISVPWAQMPADIDITFCTVNGRSGIPSFANPGCAMPGETYFNPNSSF